MERASSSPQSKGRFVTSRRQRPRHHGAAFFLGCFAAAGLLANALAAFGQTPQPMPSPVSAQTVGIYLTAIRDIDTSRNSFLAEFYIWTQSPANSPDPLAKVTIVRARTQTILYEWREKFNNQIWSLRKYRCELINDWYLANFPFDKHILAIAVVPNSDEYISPNYQVDEKNSGMAKHIAPHAWRISNFKILSQNVGYESNFGDPNATAPYQYNAVAASCLLIREPWRLFFKLLAGAYLAAVAALLGCYMKTNQPPVFAGRMGLQIACLFAAIINHRDIATATGERYTFMLTDALQLLIYVLIFASLVLTLRSRSLAERNQEARAVREERRITLCLALLFLLLNGSLIWGALAATPSLNMLRMIQIGD
jgi:hypothetical protein